MALSGEFYAPFKGRFAPSDDMASIGSVEKPVNEIHANTFIGDLQGEIIGAVAAFNSVGHCRLQVDSTSQISLQRYQGTTVPVKDSGEWAVLEVPSGGALLANTGLVAATLYRIYAYASNGAIAIEASATAHTIDADTGIRIKTGDATRTLVGMVYMDAGDPGTFVDSTSKRYCINWFNRRDLSLTGTFSADRSTNSSAAVVEIDTEIRMNLITWADDAVTAGGSGNERNDSAGQAVQTGIGIDSVTIVTSTGNTHASNTWIPWGLYCTQHLTEGFHYITLLGRVSGGTASWAAADAIATGPVKSRIWATIRG